MKSFLALAVFLALAGCAGVETGVMTTGPSEAAEAPLETEGEVAGSSIAKIKTPGSITEAQEGADAGFRSRDSFFITIGEDIASLGDPTLSGLWVRAPFLQAPEELEAHHRINGLSVVVHAEPTDGPMQMSLATFQALQILPTELPLIELRTR